MPPSPKLSVTPNEGMIVRLCEELRVTVPSLRTRTGARAKPGEILHGTYTPGLAIITLYLDTGQIEGDRLRHAQERLVETYLHELRHHYQYTHWSSNDLDNVVKKEEDAREWAARKVSEYRTIVRLGRTFPNSGFSRMSRHASRQVT